LYGLPQGHPERLKQKSFHGGFNTPYKITFTSKPWSLFLHNYKQGNTIDYNKPSDHFPFYTKHPAPTLLWTTLLLIDLHEQLSSSIYGKTLSQGTSIMQSSESINIKDEAVNHLTVDANVENPKPCRIVYQKLRQQLLPRLSSVSSKSIGANIKNIETPWLSSVSKDDLIIEQGTEDKACAITLRIPEKVFANRAEPTVLINIHTFYYHGNLRSTVPCILKAEYNETINEVENLCFQVVLDWDYMNNLAFDPYTTPCLAGLSCENGKSDIVVVFEGLCIG